MTTNGNLIAHSVDRLASYLHKVKKENPLVPFYVIALGGKGGDLLPLVQSAYDKKNDHVQINWQHLGGADPGFGLDEAVLTPNNPVDYTDGVVVLLSATVETADHLRQATNFTLSYGRPQTIRSATIFDDRENRRFPFHPDFAVYSESAPTDFEKKLRNASRSN